MFERKLQNFVYFTLGPVQCSRGTDETHDRMNPKSAVAHVITEFSDDLYVGRRQRHLFLSFAKRGLHGPRISGVDPTAWKADVPGIGDALVSPRQQQRQLRITDHDRDQYRRRGRDTSLFSGYAGFAMGVAKRFAHSGALAGEMFEQRSCAGANHRVHEIGSELHDGECRAKERMAGGWARFRSSPWPDGGEFQTYSPYTVVIMAHGAISP